MIPSKIRGFRSRVINALIDCIRAQRPVAGKGVTIQRTPTGTIISSTATGGGDITITPAAEVLRPFTIRKFEVEQASSSGTSTATKWGCYVPDFSATINYATYAQAESGEPELVAVNAERVNYAPISAENADWLDITYHIESAVNAGSPYLSAELLFDSQGNLVLSFANASEATIKAYGPDDGKTGDGYAIPIAKVSAADNVASVSNFRFGPLREELEYAQEFALMARSSTSSATGDYEKVEQGTVLSADKSYALMPKIFGRLSYADQYGNSAISDCRRTGNAWFTLTGRLAVKPLVFAGFGSIIQ